VLDIDGYFVPTGSGSTLAFYALTPCRVLDTRNLNGNLGGPYLQSGQDRAFPVLSSDCQIPSSAQAYSMNFTVVPYNGEPLGYLTVWAQGSPKPAVSTLNNLTATIVANAAIVPAGTGGEIAVYPSGNTQLVADIDGYFAPAGEGGLSLYPVPPCRVIDTRKGNGAFSGELTVDVVDSVCAPAQHGASLCVQCDGGAGRSAWLFDPVAGHRKPAQGLHAECHGRGDHLEHGDRAQH
jgi:hypothetical protein